jgi:hypothetical protein
VVWSWGPALMYYHGGTHGQAQQQKGLMMPGARTSSLGALCSTWLSWSSSAISVKGVSGPTSWWASGRSPGPVAGDSSLNVHVAYVSILALDWFWSLSSDIYFNGPWILPLEGFPKETFANCPAPQDSQLPAASLRSLSGTHQTHTPLILLLSPREP